MKYYILMGSPRKTGNTISITQPFIDELKAGGQDVELVWLYDRDIQPCKACRVCQTDWTAFGCQYQDDVQEIFDKILESDVIVFATPIYSWFCTPPMKSLLDRLVYGMDKFYGEERGPSLWEGKHTAKASAVTANTATFSMKVCWPNVTWVITPNLSMTSRSSMPENLPAN